MNTNRNKYFYSHLVDTTSISIEIADMNMTPDERKHLILLAESNIHHAVLDTVLSDLPEEHKKEFLRSVRDDDHDKIWDLLKDKAENIESKIKKTAEDLKTELLKDIEETKSNK